MKIREIEIDNHKLKTEGLRPDILHHCLITLLDTPLSKNGNLRVFFRTLSNELFYVSQKCRIPRTFNEFSLFLTELVTKFKIHSKDSKKILAQAIKHDFTSLFGNNIIGLSSKGVPMSFEDWNDFRLAVQNQDNKTTNQSYKDDYDSNENPIHLITNIPPFVIGVRAYEGLKEGTTTKLVSISPVGLTAAESYEDLIDSISSTLTSISDLPITREILSETKVGISVQKIAKEKISPISKQAENVISGWKKILDGQKNKSRSTSPPSKIRHIEKSSTYDYTGPLTDDPSRNKALNLLHSAFFKGFPQDSSEPDNETASKLIYELEKQIFESFQEKKSYSQQLNSIRFNLQDSNNPQLNHNFYNGLITPQQLSTMTPQEMASEKLKRKRELVLKESMLACQSDWAVKNILLSSKTQGQFTCFKCKQNKTVYTQVQTRSSDEPMTTFVTCLVCQNRWKF